MKTETITVTNRSGSVVSLVFDARNAIENDVAVALGVRQSLEQKVGLSPADPAFRYQTDKDQRASEPVPSRTAFCPQKRSRPPVS